MAQDTNQIVEVEVYSDTRLRLYGQITARMEQLGLNPCDYSKLGLGFELEPTWPAEQSTEITLAQLVVIACKLKMKVLINDLNLIARHDLEPEEPKGPGV